MAKTTHFPMRKKLKNFTVVIVKEDDYYIGSVPALKGCHTQGKTIDELLKNIKEAIELCLEVEKKLPDEQFVGIQQVQVKV
jgi:predicted RNase H-like HicB family nuclease